MSQNLDHIIQKYWDGETSLEEEHQLKAYLTSNEVKAEHSDLVPLFSFFTEQQSISSGALDLSFLKASNSSDIDSLVSKYWSGETTLEEEKTLQTYLTSGQVATEHMDLVPLFSYFEDQEQILMKKELDMSFLTEGVIERNIAPHQPATKVRRLFPRVAAIAASLALLLMVTFSYMDNTALTGNQNFAEVEDADEALELTMEALAFLGHKYDKGANPMKHIKQLEKANVFSFN